MDHQNCWSAGPRDVLLVHETNLLVHGKFSLQFARSQPTASEGRPPWVAGWGSAVKPGPRIIFSIRLSSNFIHAARVDTWLRDRLRLGVDTWLQYRYIREKTTVTGRDVGVPDVRRDTLPAWRVETLYTNSSSDSNTTKVTLTRHSRGRLTTSCCRCCLRPCCWKKKGRHETVFTVHGSVMRNHNVRLFPPQEVRGKTGRKLNIACKRPRAAVGQRQQNTELVSEVVV